MDLYRMRNGLIVTPDGSDEYPGCPRIVNTSVRVVDDTCAAYIPEPDEEPDYDGLSAWGVGTFSILHPINNSPDPLMWRGGAHGTQFDIVAKVDV